ncbi:MAG: FlgD immunoglobulin-like domain containing protein [Candidatus Aegiribacteria sp.]
MFKVWISFLVMALSLHALPSFARHSDTPHEIELPSPAEMGPEVRLVSPEVPLSPPDDPQVGDSWVWWLFTWYPMPPHFEQFVCTVRGMSDRGYVVVKDEEWLVSIDQDDVDAILEHWENSSVGPYPSQGIYEIDSLSFGNPPDELDDDPRIYLMWYDFEVSADGFFFWFDMYPDGTFPDYHSNECEVLYLNTTSYGGPSGDYMHAVIAHEFEHMIHWKYDDDEASWVDEGMAELAMWFYGNPDNISAFNSNPDNNLTIWDGEWADYIQTYLWSLYFFEHYGGHPAVYALVHEPANSMYGYDAVLDGFGYPENTEDIFIDWSVANFLDDTTIADGRYGYSGEDLPPFFPAGTFSTYPVAESATVNGWATDYYRFQDITFEEMEISFDGNDGNTFGVRGLVLHDAAPTEVHAMTLDEASQSGSMQITGLADPLDEVILVVASVSSAGGPEYTFSAGDVQGMSHGDPSSPGDLSLEVTPNPFTGSVSIRIFWESASEGTPSMDIYDVNGRLVRRLTADVISSGRAEAVWNGEALNGRMAGAGIYYAVARTESSTRTASLLLLP